MRRPTISDVARRAGVSTATVSKVLNKQGYVSELLRQRVLEAIHELNYQPNALARSLRSARTHTIGVVVSDIANPFMMVMARAVEETIQATGFHLLFSSTGEDPERERACLSVMAEKQVDGIILASTGQVAEAIRSLQSRRMPVVLVDRRVAGLEADLVLDNNQSGVEQLLAHLHSLGHRRVGILDGDLALPTGRERHEGVLAAMEALGLDRDPRLIFPGQFTAQGGYAGTAAFLSLPPEIRPTAIMATNNLMTAGALQALRAAGAQIPQDMALVSFGELDYYWQLQWPPLSVVTQAPEQIGREAARLLLRRIEQKRAGKPQSIVFTPKLIVRGSCGAAVGAQV